MEACGRGDVEAVTRLIGDGADVNERDEVRAATPSGDGNVATVAD